MGCCEGRNNSDYRNDLYVRTYLDPTSPNGFRLNSKELVRVGTKPDLELVKANKNVIF